MTKTVLCTAPLTAALIDTNIKHEFRSDGSWLSFKFEEYSINWLHNVR